MMWILLPLLACRASPPVITGIPEAPLLSEQKSAQELRKKKPDLKRSYLYSKRAGVVVIKLLTMRKTKTLNI